MRFSRSDLVLLRRAARLGWGVPDCLKNEAIYQAARLVADDDTDPRYRMAALRFLVAADRADLAAGRTTHGNDGHAQVEALRDYLRDDPPKPEPDPDPPPEDPPAG